MNGQRFSKLIVLRRSGSDKKRNAMWICLCDCGETTVTAGYRLRNKETKSCGCLKSSHLSRRNYRHGKTNTRLYNIWANMKARCSNESSPQYQDYGARGIHVCDEWNDFLTFFDWSIQSGYADTLSIDRIDNDLGYCPDNCRWATHDQQQEHKRCRKDAKLTSRQATEIRHCNLPTTDIAEQYGISNGHVTRIKRGEQWKPNHERTTR